MIIKGVAYCFDSQQSPPAPVYSLLFFIRLASGFFVLCFIYEGLAFTGVFGTGWLGVSSAVGAFFTRRAFFSFFSGGAELFSGTSSVSDFIDGGPVGDFGEAVGNLSAWGFVDWSCSTCGRGVSGCTFFSVAGGGWRKNSETTRTVAAVVSAIAAHNRLS